MTRAPHAPHLASPTTTRSPSSNWKVSALRGMAVAGIVTGTVLGLVGCAEEEREPLPWETATASQVEAGGSESAAPESADPAPSASATLSAEELALREAALATPQPERPAGMDEFTVEGAVATAEYFLSLYPYVYATGDLTTWQAMSDPECIFCNNVSSEVSDLHQEGGWTDPWPINATATEYGVADIDPNVWIITLDVSHSGSTDHHSSGETTNVNPEDITVLTQLHWHGQAWTVEACEVRNK